MLFRSILNTSDNTFHLANLSDPLSSNGAQSLGIVLSKDGKYLYIADFARGQLLKFDIATETVVKSILVGSGATNIAFSSDGKYLYVSNFNDTTVSVIDVATDNVVKTINVGDSPEGIAVSSDGYIFVTNSYDGTVSVIRESDYSVVGTINVGADADPVAVCYNFSNGELYIANNGNNSISVIGK